jgi:hypothetical protein
LNATGEKEAKTFGFGGGLKLFGALTVNWTLWNGLTVSTSLCKAHNHAQRLVLLLQNQETQNRSDMKASA